jgi:Mn-containing catalase
MTREVAHQKSFEKALYAIDENFPAGKLPGKEEFSSLYVNASQGEGDMQGPWNAGDMWDRDEGPTPALDGGDGTASVMLDGEEKSAFRQLQTRTMSDPAIDAVTGADLGAGPGAGRTTVMED